MTKKREANTMKADTPKIYVACLGAYNSGKLHGKWIDADQDPEEINEEIQEVLRTSPERNAEEFAIHDYEGFEGFNIDEYEQIECVSELALAISEHGKVFALYASDVGLEFALENFEEAFNGEWSSEIEFAEQLMNDCYEVPEHLENYIDYESFARDLFMSDYNSHEDGYGSVYVFNIL